MPLIEKLRHSAIVVCEFVPLLPPSHGPSQILSWILHNRDTFSFLFPNRFLNWLRDSLSFSQRLCMTRCLQKSVSAEEISFKMMNFPRLNAEHESVGV